MVTGTWNDSTGVYTEFSTYYLQSNHLGATVQATDSAGVAVASIDYERYGAKYVTGTGFDVGGAQFGPGLPGQHQASGAPIHNGHRSYNSHLGMYLQPEPLMQSSGAMTGYAAAGLPMRSYGYAAHNPMTYVDSTGLSISLHALDLEIAGEAGRGTEMAAIIARYRNHPAIGEEIRALEARTDFNIDIWDTPDMLGSDAAWDPNDAHGVRVQIGRSCATGRDGRSVNLEQQLLHELGHAFRMMIEGPMLFRGSEPLNQDSMLLNFREALMWENFVRAPNDPVKVEYFNGPNGWMKYPVLHDY